MPMHVAVALLTPQGQDVDALGGKFRPQGLSDTMDKWLNPQVLLGSETSRDMLTVFTRRDEGIAECLHEFASFLVWSACEEGHGELVFVERVMWVIRMTAQKSAYKTRSIAGPFDIRFKVIRLAGTHG